MVRSFIADLFVIAALNTYTGSALAMDEGTRTAARNLVNEGASDFKAGSFAQARDKFLEALSVAQVPTVAVWAARAHERLGKLVAAVDLYERALLMQPNELWLGSLQRDAQRHTQIELRALRQRVPRLRLEFEPGIAPGAQVSIDGVALPSQLLSAQLPVDPGTHSVVAVSGGTKVERRVTLAEGTAKTVTFQWP